MAQLKDGYIILKNKLTDTELEYGTSSIQGTPSSIQGTPSSIQGTPSSIQGTQVDYTKVKSFIDDIFLYKIKELGIMTDPHYVKFRLSNNNNSTDASTFHGDIYNHTSIEILPIYTCLCYFDDAQLEIIPGSHKYNNLGSSIKSYNKKQIIHVSRGDILIFHSNIHHRGINFNKTSNRRLLQVFEVFPDKETYDEHSSKLIIVKTSDSMLVKNIVSPLMYELATYPTIINFLTMVHYILMYNDLHYKMSFMDIDPAQKKDHYITYEPTQRIHDLNKTGDLNVNIICDTNVKTVSYSNYYLYFYIIYWIVSFILIYFIYKLWKPKKTKLRKRFS